MKLAYVYDAVYPWETGGVQARVWELARRLADDHDVHWYGLHYWDGPRIRESEGVTLHGVAEPQELYVNGRRSIREALSFSAHLVRPLLHERFDVIDCQEFPYFPGFPSKLATTVDDSTLVMTWHEVWDEYWYEYLGWKGLFGKLTERSVARLPDKHIAVSKRTQQDLAVLGVSCNDIVPNGIAMDDVERVPEANEQVDVLFVGRLIEEKNPALLVRAIDELRESTPDIRCRFVGEGPEADRVEQLVGQLDLDSNVTVTGFRDSHDAVLGLMKAADVFVLPSRREGFGMTVLESLACGTPVVTIDHPQNAAAELVEDGATGVICEATPRSVADGIERARRTVSGDDCVATARNYEWDRIVREIETIYRELA